MKTNVDVNEMEVKIIEEKDRKQYTSGFNYDIIDLRRNKDLGKKTPIIP